MNNSNRSNSKALIYDGTTYRSVNISKIKKCESDKGYVDISLEGFEKPMTCICTLTNCEELLKCFGIFCINRGILINLHDIDSLDRKTKKVTLTNKETLDVAPDRFNELVVAMVMIHQCSIGNLPENIQEMIDILRKKNLYRDKV